MLIRFFSAFVPGPVVLRAISDGACLSWQEDCFHANKCWHYDMNIFRYAYNGFACVTLILAGLSLIPAYIISIANKCPYDTEQGVYSDQEQEVKTPEDENMEESGERDAITREGTLYTTKKELGQSNKAFDSVD